MNFAIASSLIGVLGAAFVAVLVVVLQFVRSEMATKGDLAESLAGLATKADLVGLATKADLAGLATKSDLAGVEKDLAGMATKSDVAELKESLARVEATQAAHGKQLERMADHGERLAALEGAVSVAS